MHARFVLVLAAAACGPSTVEDAELREICGEVGPARVLEFPEDTRPFAHASVSRLGDDRLLWQVAFAEPDDENYPFPLRWGGAWITGICGESPTQVPDVTFAYLDPNLPGVILSPETEDPFGVEVFDPDALDEPRLLFDHFGFPLGSTGHGVLSFDERDVEIASLSFRPYPADPFSGVVASTTLARFDVPSTGSSEPFDAIDRVVVREDWVWVLTSDDELVRIELPSGAKSVEQVGVRSFEISDDERWLVWEDLTVLDHGEVFDEPVGRSHLRDRNEGTERSLWIGHAFPWDTHSAEDGLVFGPDGWVHVEDLSPLGLPADRTLQPPIGESRQWLTLRRTDPAAYHEPVAYARFDVATSTETPLYDHPAWATGWRADGLELMHGIQLGTPPTPTEAPLWFVPFDRSAPQQLARAATSGYLRMADGRIVTPLRFSPDFRSATMMLVDPDTLETSRIDDHVFVHDGLRQPDPEIWGDDVLLYSVGDGDRSGMWIARLP